MCTGVMIDRMLKRLFRVDFSVRTILIKNVSEVGIFCQTWKHNFNKESEGYWDEGMCENIFKVTGKLAYKAIIILVQMFSACVKIYISIV